MRTALIGYTGFVGGTVASQNNFDELYNSSNISTIAGKNFDLVVCAGTPGVKWKANLEPEVDLRAIEHLLENLAQVKTEKFVALSTVDVYPEPRNVNEDTQINSKVVDAYGRNRFYYENKVAEFFPNVLVIRLPALFGEGLKKNAVFDLIHNNMIDSLHPDSEFQYYNMIKLWEHIKKLLEQNITKINLVTPPIKLGVIAKESLGLTLQSKKEAKVAAYDVQTKYGEVFGNKQPYIAEKDKVLKDLIEFIRQQRKVLE